MILHSPPRLPPELEREIFEIAALSHPALIPALVRVSRRVHHWILPLLFNVLCIDDSAQSDAFLSMIQTYPLEYLASSVRHLFFDNMPDSDGPCTVDQASTILEACVNLYDFATISQYSHPGLLPILPKLRITRLAVCFTVLFDRADAIDLGHPFLSNITHLDVFDPMDTATATPDNRICDLLPTLPCLTHLCLNNEGDSKTIAELLQRSPRLQLLVILRPGHKNGTDEDQARMSDVSDDRLVFATFRDYWKQWKDGAHGLPNFWTDAEAVVAQRRQKRVRVEENTSY